MRIKLIHNFLFSAGVIMLAAAILRISILFQGTLSSRMLLAATDGIFGFSVGDELWGIAIVELLIASGILFINDLSARLWLLAWAAINYFVIKIAMSCLNLKFESSCLGVLSDPFHLSRGPMGILLKMIPYYLLFGATASLGCLCPKLPLKVGGKKHERPLMTPAGFWKMVCPVCGVHIQFDERNLGRKIPCPQCQKTVTLRKPENLRMSCFF